MTTHKWYEPLIKQRVTFALIKDGKLYVIENVPARVNTDMDEQLFSPETVEKLQQIILGNKKPVQVIETPVYEVA